MNQFARLHKIINDEQVDKIRNTTVLVVGLGGVGSYVVESLARSGINSLILVDYDIVDITNLNRQLGALHSTIGHKKIDVIENRLKDINPNINITKISDKILTNNIDLLFKNDFDYLVDACDTLVTKCEIIKACLKNNKKFISSMGTGNKFNPEKLKIMDIRETTYDPVARIIRKMIKNDNLTGMIKVVSSTEKGIKIQDRTPGSNSFVPSVAGLLCSSYVINDILKTQL